MNAQISNSTENGANPKDLVSGKKLHYCEKNYVDTRRDFAVAAMTRNKLKLRTCPCASSVARVATENFEFKGAVVIAGARATREVSVFF